MTIEDREEDIPIKKEIPIKKNPNNEKEIPDESFQSSLAGSSGTQNKSTPTTENSQAGNETQKENVAGKEGW